MGSSPRGDATHVGDGNGWGTLRLTIVIEGAMIGRRLSHYVIGRRLGAGGMGEVYLARDSALGRDVAIKVVPEEMARDPEFVERLRREGRALAALDHPNIVTVHSVEEADGVLFLTMAYVPGDTLDERIPTGGLPVDAILRYGIALADALAAAHDRGIVHRDLKPRNVIVDASERLRVLDFGLAKMERPEPVSRLSIDSTLPLTAAGSVIGTCHYMSPEQAEGRPVDARSDLFSLGILLFEMATGERPFDGASAVAILSAILKDDPAPVGSRRPDLPEELQSVIGHCLAKDPALRPTSAKEVADRFRDLLRRLETAPSKTRTAPRLRRLGVGVVLVAALGLGTLLVTDRKPEPNEPAAATPADEASIESLGVLPLRNLSGDPEQEYFAEGMTEALISGLSRIQGIEVISRTSTSRFRSSDTPLAEIGAALGVQALVEGSVVREADRVRITARLVEASTGRNLWDDRFDRELTSILSFQSEIARAVADRIGETLRQGARNDGEGGTAAVRTVRPSIYDLYLRGMWRLNQGAPGSLGRAIELFEEAVRRDPDEALAHAGLAIAYARLGHDRGSADVAFPRAIAAAETALRLDPELAEANLAMGEGFLYHEWDFGRADEAIARAIELNPSSSEAHGQRAYLDIVLERPDEAIASAETAVRVDPFSPVVYAWLAGVHQFVGDPESGLIPARRAVELAPQFALGWWQLGSICIDLERYQEAIAAHEKARELEPTWGWELPRALFLAGRPQEARRALRAYEDLPGGPDPLFLGLVYATFGDTDKALDALEQAFDSRHRFMPWLPSWGAAEPLRSEPRFEGLVERLGLEGAPSLRETRSSSSATARTRADLGHLRTSTSRPRRLPHARRGSSRPQPTEPSHLAMQADTTPTGMGAGGTASPDWGRSSCVPCRPWATFRPSTG